MQRIEVNVRTGERKVLELTPAEVADAADRFAAENLARPKAQPNLQDVISVLSAEQKAALDEIVALRVKL